MILFLIMFIFLLFLLCSNNAVSQKIQCSSSQFLCHTYLYGNLFLHLYGEKIYYNKKEMNNFPLDSTCLSKSDARFCNGNCDCFQCSDEPRIQCASLHNQCKSMEIIEKPFGWLAPLGLVSGYYVQEPCHWLLRLGQRERIHLHLAQWHSRTGDRLLFFDIPKEYKVNGLSNVAPQLLAEMQGGLAPTHLRFCSQGPSVVVKWLPGTLLVQSSPSYFNITWRACGGPCLLDERACPLEQGSCFTENEKCDGVHQCQLTGIDELGCNGCRVSEFTCGVGDVCYSQEQRCDGHDDCNTAVDEHSCSTTQCGPHNGTFLCPGPKGRCISARWRCDGTADCSHAEDEQNCVSDHVEVRVLVAILVGATISGLLLLITIVYTCRGLRSRRMANRQSAIRRRANSSQVDLLGGSFGIAHAGDYDGQFNAAFWNFMPRPPPPYDEAMRTSRPFPPPILSDNSRPLSQREVRLGGRCANLQVLPEMDMRCEEPDVALLQDGCENLNCSSNGMVCDVELLHVEQESASLSNVVCLENSE